MTTVSATGPGVAPSRGVRVAAYLYGGAVTAALGYFLLGIPVQLTETFANLQKLDAGWRELLVGEFTQQSFLRPLLFAQLKLVYDASGGDYFAWFRGVHVAQVAVLVGLYVHLVRPRTWRDAAAMPIGLAALIGLHTFNGTVREAFPINTFLTIVLCVFAAAALVLGRYRWWNDVLALLLLAGAALTVESGLLVAVVIVGGAIVGGRGVSRIGVALTVALVAAYVVLRTYVLDIGSPGLTERASGFGFRVLETSDLAQRFGDNPWPFYIYNVVTSVVSVLFSEPRNGVFRLVDSLINEVRPALIVSAVASLAATGAIAWSVWYRRRAWRAWRLDHGDRLVALFVAVLFANAVISYPYTKDVIMSPAGAFYSLAAFVAFQRILQLEYRRRAAAVLVATVCLVAGAAWAVRAAGTHLDLRLAAIQVRNEWAYADQWFERNRSPVEGPRAEALLRDLRDDAIVRRATATYLSAMRCPYMEVGG
jgi:hypothetical protein